MDVKKKLKSILDKKDENFFKNNEVLLLSNSNSEIYREESMKRKKFVNVLREVTNLFSKEEGWCIIKIKEIPKAHSDVDMLIDPRKYDLFKKILLEKGFEFMKSFGEGTFTFTKEGVKVDVQKSLPYPKGLGKKNYFSYNKILERVKKKSLEKMTFNYVSEEDDFLIFSAHSLFSNDTTQDYKGNSTFNLSDLYQFYRDSKRRDFDWDYIKEISTSHNWNEGIYYAIKITRNIFPSDSLKKGELILGRTLKKSQKEKIDFFLDKKITFPHIILKPFLFKMCFKKSLKERSLKTFFAYLRWFLYNKFAVLLKKSLLRK